MTYIFYVISFALIIATPIFYIYKVFITVSMLLDTKPKPASTTLTLLQNYASNYYAKVKSANLAKW